LPLIQPPLYHFEILQKVLPNNSSRRFLTEPGLIWSGEKRQREAL
jgi:hypothetical protein